MKKIKIDLFSDTITRPSKAMREFMAGADVGDEQQGEDPTVNKLIETICDLLEKEDGIYLPSGTMCNQVAFRVHCSPGDEIIMDQTAHTRHYETGGPSALSGVSIFPLPGDRGIFNVSHLSEAIRPVDNHFPRSRVVLIEQTSNLGGGSVWPLKTIREVCNLAKKYGLACHMDGARLLNAVSASGVPAKDYCAEFDSVWIDFSKGLGAPVGAVLAGSKDFIQKAWRWKHQFGGAMRQAGIIAAGALYALENNIERLADDHVNAQLLAEGLGSIDGIEIEPVETNIVFFSIQALGVTDGHFNNLLMEKGVRLSTMGRSRLRAVTHLDVCRSQVEEALAIIRDVVQALKNK
jgi:threonine aldolase